MSGGSMNYLFTSVNDAADEVADEEFSDLLKDVADVLHALEWWESGDWTYEQYKEALATFKAKWFHGSREARLKGCIDDALERTKAELYALIGVKGGLEKVDVCNL